MGLAQLQHWGRAQLLHDRVRISTNPADLVLPDVNVVHVRRCSPVHPKHIRRQAEELGVGFRARPCDVLTLDATTALHSRPPGVGGE
ncbi:hypothetical protein TSOC_013580 [Tetrabaena socialis]|uniref:Uncharacterized protein n=1 Tax=Tetrabaena socialis TaxID=47790 RepID=A0A2J7ZK00_9CHLO|nr:hypothetical protein TSOC_013580 [Tetrabaena socialis]|eukprot:PNH00591.1 hypothetical protein TSOC_013580 [Tetrabaena socialis]